MPCFNNDGSWILRIFSDEQRQKKKNWEEEADKIHYITHYRFIAKRQDNMVQYNFIANRQGNIVQYNFIANRQGNIVQYNFIANRQGNIVQYNCIANRQGYTVQYNFIAKREGNTVQLLYNLTAKRKGYCQVSRSLHKECIMEPSALTHSRQP